MTMTARPGLASLNEIDLSPFNQRRLEQVSADIQGVDPWQDRKKSEARQLLALEQLAGAARMRVMSLDLEQDLRSAVWLDVPVAMTPAIKRGASITSYPSVEDVGSGAFTGETRGSRASRGSGVPARALLK